MSRKKRKKTALNWAAEFKLATGKTATLYTRDPAVMRKVDSLVNEYPDAFKCIGVTDMDKTYEFPKSAVTYSKPRNISEAHRKAASERMRLLNETRKE